MACNKKGSGTRSGQDGLAKVPPVAAAPLPIPATNPHEDQLGHFVLDDLESFTQQVQRAATKPGQSPTFGLEDLRGAIAKIAPSSELADKISFREPIGCVTYDPMVYLNKEDWPGVCFFGYQGGAKRFVKDISSKVVTQASSAKHLFSGKLGERNIYIDELNGAVILSGQDGRYAASIDYLKKNIFQRKSPFAGLTIDLYLSDLFQRYEAILRGSLERVMEKRGLSLAAMNVDPADTKKAIDRVFKFLKESEQLRLGLHSDAHRFTLSLSHRVKEHAPYFSKAVSQAYTRTLDTELVARMPKDLVMLMASVVVPESSQSSSEDQFKLRTQHWNRLAKTLEKDPAWVQRMLGYERAIRSNLGDQVAAGIFPNAQGPGSMVFMGKTAQGASLQEKWRAELATWDPKTWGPKFNESFTFEFRPSAKHVDGVTLDEIRLTAKESAVAKLKASMGQEKFDAMIAVLGSLSLVVHLGQIEHIAFGVATTHDVDQSSSKVISALRGIDNFVADQEFAATAATFQGNSFAAVVDSGPVSRLFLSARKALEQTELQARNGLQDSQLITRIDPKQGSALRWSISTPLLPLVQDAADRNSKKASMAR